MDEKELEKLLKALANKRRLLILKFLKKKNKLSVGGIASLIKLSFKSTSKHLSVLSGAGIVEKEQVGLTVFYKISQTKNNLLKVISELI